ncbi:MAG: helix-turn-helix transcriptional regulator [Flavobacteriales bacterium]|nr:helix-turn-helix transcriptional regulator [Flavobacteriales bacterium]
MITTLHIKNMVCPRCIETVQNIFHTLRIEVNSVILGEVTIPIILNTTQKTQLEEVLLKNGFELLRDAKSQLVSRVKAIVVDRIHHKTESLKVNFSTFLSEELDHEYTSLSKLFSSVEGITIERFILKQKMEKVKELLFYDELTLSEIAFKMQYSSAAYLSSQFKKETGMTPSMFKRLKHPNRQSLDSL